MNTEDDLILLVQVVGKPIRLDLIDWLELSAYYHATRAYLMFGF